MGRSRTRAWKFVEQEAKRLAALGQSANQIAKQVGVNGSTVRRWLQSGKLDAGKTSAPGHAAKASRSPEEWARNVRASYQLDATDDQRVTAGEICLKTFHDTSQPISLRLQAMARFDAIAKNLNLVARLPVEPAAPKDVEKPERPRMVRSGDPRSHLTAVK